MKELYRVKPRETIRDIAAKYHIDRREILSYNRIREEDIRAGALLVINRRAGEKYIVAPFDTLAKIAAKFNVSEERIRDNNDIKEVFLGELIYIPKD